MGQQIKFLEENETAFSSVSYFKHSLSPKSKKSINVAVKRMDLESHFKCCCKHSFKECQAVGTDTCDLGTIIPPEMMKSVSLHTSNPPPLPAFSVCNVSSSDSINLKSDIWNVTFDKSELNNTGFGCQVDALDDCSSQLCSKSMSSIMPPKLNRVDSTCQLESAGLNCTFTTDLCHSLVNETNQCPALENHRAMQPDQDSDSCDMEIIKNYISDLDEDFEEYSASECEENSSSDYNLAELTTLEGGTKTLFHTKSDLQPENLIVTFKGLTVAKSNIKVLNYGNEKQYHCSACESIFTDRCMIMSHLGSHVGFQPFQCVICNESTPCESEACAHYEMHFGNEETNVIVGGVILNENQFAGETNSTGEDDIFYHCERCGKTFNSSATLTSHMDSHKMTNKTASTNFSCTLCKDTFMSHSELESHSLEHSSDNHIKTDGTKSRQKERVGNKTNPMPCKERNKREKVEKVILKSCEVCNKTFRTTKALREHEVVHTGARDFPCDICGKAFGTGANMRIHRLTHSNIRPFSCQTCGATFRQKDSLKVHARKHSGERPYVCNICKMTFDRSFTLKNHMLTHASEKLFVCSVCGKTFSTRGGLNNHERLHFKDPSEPKKERGPRAKPGTGDWACSECGKIYSTRSNLRMHQRTHQPSQVCHVCPVCAKVYKSRDSMEVHMRTHSEERPYKCPTCSRSFYRNYTLKLHILTHTGEKPHKCPVEGCDRSFAQTSSLSYHVRNHKKREERSDRSSNNKQKHKKQSSALEFSLGKADGVVGDLMELPVSENCPPLNETHAIPQPDLKMLKMGMNFLLHDNAVENIVLGENQSETHVQSTVDLSGDIGQLGHVPTVVWEDNISLMGIMNNVHVQPPHQPLTHHSGEDNLHPEHCSQVELMQLLPSETLPLLVSAPETDLFHQDCSERAIGTQALLVQRLS